MEKTVNFLTYGKLGDFTHSLFAVRQYCIFNNVKANIYMVDIGWEFGIENTYNELLSILLRQDYINSFEILKNYKLDPIQTPKQSTPIEIFDEKLKNEGYIDLGAYIRSPLLYKACWSEIYADLCKFEINKEKYKSIEFDEIDSRFENKIIIHRRTTSLDRLNNDFPWENLINIAKDKVVFISTSEKDFNEFPYNKGINFHKIKNMLEWYRIIKSGYLLITNLSAPESIGRALDVPRIIELPYTIDVNHIIGETKYTDNLYWYQNSEKNNCQEIFNYS